MKIMNYELCIINIFDYLCTINYDASAYIWVKE